MTEHTTRLLQRIADLNRIALEFRNTAIAAVFGWIMALIALAVALHRACP